MTNTKLPSRYLTFVPCPALPLHLKRMHILPRASDAGAGDWGCGHSLRVDPSSSHLTLLQCGTCPGAEGGKFLLQCRLLPRGQCLEPLLLSSSSPPIHSCGSSMVLINLTDFSFTLDPAWFPKGFCIVLFYYFIFILFLISATHLLS